jgi:hypothetical protein
MGAEWDECAGQGFGVVRNSDKQRERQKMEGRRRTWRVRKEGGAVGGSPDFFDRFLSAAEPQTTLRRRDMEIAFVNTCRYSINLLQARLLTPSPTVSAIGFYVCCNP